MFPVMLQETRATLNETRATLHASAEYTKPNSITMLNKIMRISCTCVCSRLHPGLSKPVMRMMPWHTVPTEYCLNFLLAYSAVLRGSAWQLVAVLSPTLSSSVSS